jgi:adenylosuccinate synthase
LVAISGPVCAGKSTLANGLAEGGQAKVLTTRLLIARFLDRRPEELSRAQLQEAGDRLDLERGGGWVADEIAVLRLGEPDLIVVDSIRNAEQLAEVRAVSDAFHVHLRADEAILAARYAERSRSNPQLEFPDFNGLRSNLTEAHVEGLGRGADLLLDTGGADAAETRSAVLGVLGWLQ